MNAVDTMRYALCAYVAAALAACGGMGAPTGGLDAAARTRTPRANTYTVLHSFGNAADGQTPESKLLDLRGTLYGTTLAGGSGCYASGGCGTVFSISTTGNESVLHSFGGASDGAFPFAGLIAVKNTFYGTTDGGASTGGTVFSMKASGDETPLYHFKNSPDGYDPHSAVTDVGGTMYGTTFFGGSKDSGTVYALAPSGHERVLYSFVGRSGNHADGKYPNASLLDLGGTFYGTTYKGGNRDRGAVFKITSSGSEAVLHSFQGGARDGAFPRGGLVDIDGTLYGTATAGEIGQCKGCGDHEHFGAIFKITTAGKESVLYKFKGYPSDGANPSGDLLNVNGTLYGVTETGGAGCSVTHGCGTIFSLTPSGAETVLHSFQARTDGALPLAGLIDVDGTLYGTTSQGGPYNGGTAFALTP